MALTRNYPLGLTLRTLPAEESNGYAEEWTLEAGGEAALKYVSAVCLTPAQALRHLLVSGR